MAKQGKFKLCSKYKPTGDQPAAIDGILKGVTNGKQVQVVLGATGTGKTFTDANIIEKLNKPTLVMVHNKTLASQLYGELKELFPNNRVEYYVSNFDYYQPEAYKPKTDTYIEKEAVMNDEIEMLRTSAINSVIERNDTIVVASVAAIYGLTDPDEYRGLVFEIRQGEILDREKLMINLIDSQYKRDDFNIKPGTFRVRGDVIDIAPMQSTDYYIRIETFGDEVDRISHVNKITGEVKESFQTHPIYPAYDHAATRKRIEEACETIKSELKLCLEEFRKEGKFLEAERLEMRTLNDMESMLEFGRCPGIENYSAHIDKRKPGERPWNLIDYFPNDFVLMIDESHVTIPQIRGMYNGDRSRKETLIKYGFRLPSALDNRPLKFDEFENLMPKTVVCTSATPGEYELRRCEYEVVEQIIRPTGLLDPEIEVRPTMGQINDIISEIRLRKENDERVIIVTITIKMAEDLTNYLRKEGLNVAYIHSETKTLERTEIIYDLRRGKYDAIIGINLLREGIDIPECSLICILDADKQGLFRSTTSLIQIIGRAARNEHGKVIMYADSQSQSMQEAIDETARRREIQIQYNKDNNIVPKTIIKPLRPPLTNYDDSSDILSKLNKTSSKTEIKNVCQQLEKEMLKAAKDFDFEEAARLRDMLFETKALL